LEAKRLELVAERKEGLWNENHRFFHRKNRSFFDSDFSFKHPYLVAGSFILIFLFGIPELAVFQLIRKSVIDLISL
jgi:hypothetical protein